VLEHAVSADGTRIAFERFGTGDPIVLLGGMFCDRGTHRPLAEALAGQFTAVTVDRRGRGDSGDTSPYAVDREIEDVDAVIGAVGGSASIYGHSSGAGLAFRAAAAGLPIDRLVLHEPPFGGDDAESRAEARRLASEVRGAIEEDRPSDAIRSFLAAMGTPPEAADEIAGDPAMLRLASTMPYDHAVMGDDAGGGAIPVALAQSITVPTLVLAGSASPDFFRDTAERLTNLIPSARYTVLDGQDHGAPAEAVAPAVAEFVASG
jgi:pimeloyl-ACP methyl ester carboxylesterase